ncbi:carbohydrate ABC transporter permease [Streptomyces sp. NPDC058045]|uniref:carbohydrate ABC transporter permease n=1 Tax=Streptomyces sp. NPDC058045 TaxID=3346311 RepID=UPI0036E9082A
MSATVAGEPAKAAPGGTRSAARPTGRRREAWIRRLPLLPALIYLIVLTQLPFLATLYYSVRSWNLLTGRNTFAGLDNYAAAFTDPTYRTAVLNTVVITSVTVLLSLVLGVGLALLINERFLGRGVVRTLLITPFLIMPTAAALLWKYTMLDPEQGMVNALLGLFGVEPVAWLQEYPLTSIIVAGAWQWTPFMMLIVLAGLQSMPHDVVEAAAVDGAGRFTVFRYLTVPHLKPFMQLGVLLGAINVVSTFDGIFMMTQGGPGTATTNLPYFLYQQAFQSFEIGRAAALGVVTVIGTIIVAQAALRLLSGLLAGPEAR